jgi:uncharacterized membrane protein
MDELNSPEPSSVLRIGRLLFALSVVASGIYQLVTGRFVNLIPVNPAHVLPWHVYLLGVLLVLAGVGLLARRTVPAAAITLGVLLLACLGLGLWVALAHASLGYVWVDPLMVLAILGGVGLAAFRRDGSPGRAVDGLFETAARFAPWALGAFLAYCGVTHSPYAKYVAGLIPTWIPGHMFWTYFAALALIAGGIGVVVRERRDSRRRCQGSCSSVGSSSCTSPSPSAHTPSARSHADFRRSRTVPSRSCWPAYRAFTSPDPRPQDNALVCVSVMLR